MKFLYAIGYVILFPFFLLVSPIYGIVELYRVFSKWLEQK